MVIKALYDSITKFADKYNSVKWSDSDNVEAYKKLVDKCILYGKIPECNREEYCTHGALTAAIIYESNRESFCEYDGGNLIPKEIVNDAIKAVEMRAELSNRWESEESKKEAEGLLEAVRIFKSYIK